MDEMKEMRDLKALCVDFGVNLSDAIDFLRMVMTKYNFVTMYKMLGYANVRQFINETPDDVLIDRLEGRNAAIAILEETCSPASAVPRNPCSGLIRQTTLMPWERRVSRTWV